MGHSQRMGLIKGSGIVTLCHQFAVEDNEL